MYFIIALFNLIPPYLNRVLVDDYIQADTMPELHMFVAVLLSLLGVQIFIRILGISRSVLLILAGNKVVVALREMVFNKIQMLSIARIAKRTAGELITRVSRDTSELTGFITRDLGNIIEQGVTLIAVSIVLFAYDWRLALMIILPTPIVMYANRLFWSFMHKMFHKQWILESKSSTVLHDIFSGIRVVKAFGMEHRETERFNAIIEDQRDTSIRNEKFFGVVNPILSFFMGVGEFFLLYYVGNKILGGEMTIGEMSQFSAYVSIIYGPLRWMSSIPRRLVRLMTSIVKIFDVIDEEPDIADKAEAIEHQIEGTITFDNVSFGYNNTTNVLKNLSVEIHPGEMIGIVGKSGVGKSTLINLVMRMYDVNEGSLKIDGIDIRDISQDSLRSQIGVVLQETFLFSGTIYDNIAYAKPAATRDEVITAAKIAGAHSFIMKLPNAYNTKVGERGHTLSGGERQRVAIARALLHNPRILILDEATASLDTETEKQIQDALQKLIADRTTLAIAHRLSTLRNATKILVLDKGGLAEMGTHEELI
ncbi:MAG: ABC transporter ATP-binding protein, partial [Firmicutes bacterium]|nr:ABC transporter ATP-binding protein [Bacillota bacterium]